MTEANHKVFAFGENWQAFSKLITEDRIEAAQTSLINLVGTADLTGKTFLDIGCGSGLFAIAAAQMGAIVTGIDLDPVSVQTSQANAQKWLPAQGQVNFMRASILDVADLEKRLPTPQFEIVYSWGVLHHTGNMQQALQNAVQLVRPGGQFVISIYNRHITSPVWVGIKWLYNQLPKFLQKLLIWMFAPVIFMAKGLVTRKNPLTMHRHGMDFMYNVVDWLGGYPYEYVSVTEMQQTLQKLGADSIRVIPAQVPTGCNEFVCSMKKAV